MKASNSLKSVSDRNCLSDLVTNNIFPHSSHIISVEEKSMLIESNTETNFLHVVQYTVFMSHNNYLTSSNFI